MTLLSASIASLLAGLMGSPHCMGMCGGFAVGCSKTKRSLMAWHLGRLLTYGILGGIAGFLGEFILGPDWLRSGVAMAMLLLFAVSIVGWLPPVHLKLPQLVPIQVSLLRKDTVISTFLFGVLNGVLPCGLVYAALAGAVALGHPLQSSLAMIGFGMGTIPALSLVALSGSWLRIRGKWARYVVAGGILASGMWSISQRVQWNVSGEPLRHEVDR